MKKICIIALTLFLFSGQNVWAINDFSDINGTTITIHSTDEMTLLAQNVNGGNTYNGYTFLLDTDLVYDGTANNYTAIGIDNTKYFAGTFDGQGYTISGINISAGGRQGLFGSVSGGTIKNLKGRAIPPTSALAAATPTWIPMYPLWAVTSPSTSPCLPA